MNRRRTAVASQPPRGRRRPWLAAIATACMAAALAIIVLPGMPADRGPEFRPPPPALPMPARLTLVQTWEHGWPWPYLTREVQFEWNPFTGTAAFAPPAKPLSDSFDYDLPADRTLVTDAVQISGEAVVWTSPAAWQFAEGRNRVFFWGAAAADAAVVALLLAAVWLGVGRWLRRRGGVLRWQMIDILALCTLAALVLGWRQYGQRRYEAHRRVHRTLSQLTSRWWRSEEIARGYAAAVAMNDGQSMSFKTGMLEPLARPQWRDWRYAGPEWLARLLGSRQRLPFCQQLSRIERRSDQFWLSGMFSDGRVEGIGVSKDLTEIWFSSRYCLIEDLAPLAELPQLRRLDLEIAATEDELDRFFAETLQGRVQRVTGNQFESADQVALRRLRRRLRQEGPEPGNTDPRYLSLESIPVDDETLATFAPFLTRYARRLTLGPAPLTIEGIAILGQCQHLDDLDLGTAWLSGRELAALRPLLLRELTLRQGDLTIDDLASLADMHSLVALTVRESTFTPAERKRLGAALGQIELAIESKATQPEP